MGTPEYAATVLRGLLKEKKDVIAVVCQPDAYVGRKKVLTFCPVKQVAIDNGIPVLQPHRIREDFQEIINYQADLIITCAYGQILPHELLNSPKYGCVNLHGSLLPKYRGASPIQEALKNGDKETGVSLMYMNEKMDEGNIIFQETIKIEDSDNATTLFLKMADLSTKLLLKHYDELFYDNVISYPQDHSQATYTKLIKASDEYLDFNKDCVSLFNQVRALSDNPGAYTVYEDSKYKLYEPSYLKEETNLVIGSFIGLKEDKLAFVCSDGYIMFNKILPQGKKLMNAKDFYNGKGRSLVDCVFGRDSI